MVTQSDLHDKRVAIVAVHGVGSPEKGETLRQVVELLQRASDDYSPFTETSLHIPVTPLTAGSFPEPPKSPDTAFSYKTIHPELVHTDDVRRYRTLKLSGRLGGKRAAKDIDCYEMYWEDFSSVSRNTPRILAELYQLLFHLASLGRKTVLEACKHAPAPALGFLGNVHRLIATLLPTSIPIANLYLVPMFLPLLAFALTRQSAAVAAALLAGLLSFGLLYRAAYAVGNPMLGWPALVPAAAAGWLVYAYGDGHTFLGALLLFAGLALAWLGTSALTSRYGETLQRCARWGGLLAALAVLGLGYLLLPHNAGIASLAGSAFLMVFKLLNVLWKLLFVLMVAAAIAPFLVSDPAGYRAARTGRIGLLASATLFLITTLLLWSWVFNLAGKTSMDKLQFTVPAVLSGLCGAPGLNFREVGQCLFNVSTNGSGNWFLALVAAALALLVAAIIPSAWYEAVPDRSGAAPGNRSKLWRWLDNAYRPLIVAELVVLGAWLVLGILPLVPGAASQGGNLSWFLTAGGIMAAAIPLAVLLRSYIPGVAAALLDIMLDVSNWLRERPWDCNPRGRIMTRYIALLEYLVKEQAYDRVVIVSYSQGTVISADTLKLLTETGVLEQWPKSRIMLLTLGCPLQQLYAQRFPDWYGWIHTASPATLGVCAWANGYRTGDYVGRSLWGGNERSAPPATPHGAYDFCVGEGAHLHYFDGTAGLVGAEIDRLVDSPVECSPARQAVHAPAARAADLAVEK